MSDAVRALMASAYPELLETAGRVNHILDEEETRFSRTVNIGLKKLDEEIDKAAANRRGTDLGNGGR